MNERRSARKRVTLTDVAQHAGFSRSTASLVFQESPLVAASTRERVLKAANELGYVYNRGAASLRRSRSNTIGLLVAGLTNPFFTELIGAVEEELVGYTVLLGDTLDDRQRQADLITTMLEFNIDGLLVVPALGSRADFVAPLERLGVPYIILTRHVVDLDSPYVGVDDFRGGQIAAEHLVAHACRTLAYFGGPDQTYVRRRRFAGLRDVAEQAGIAVDDHWSRPTRTASLPAYEAAATLLRGSEEVADGIVCHSDAIAFGLMRALCDVGLRVGKDVRVIGFDDVEWARTWSPSLTSISVEAHQMGHSAGRLLIKMIEGASEAEPLIFEPSLRMRESCGDGHETAELA